KGAVLLTLKSVDTLHIAQMLNGSYYVGLNDVMTEGTFVFNSDNTVLDDNVKTQLFAATHPDDTSGNEDCVTYAESMKGLNDVPCCNQGYYVCEKLCFEP
ncbi:C-type lectin mannose-binding isoform, partial [Biomphalaria glabrata]